MNKKTKIYLAGAGFIAAVFIAVYFCYYKPNKEKSLLKDKQIAENDKEIETLKKAIEGNNTISQNDKNELNELSA
jgi:hypothetical protein